MTATDVLFDAPPARRCPEHGCYFERGHDPEHGHGSDTCDECGEPHLDDERCPPKPARRRPRPDFQPGFLDCPIDCDCGEGTVPLDP